MICTDCKFWKENKCIDEVIYVDENGDSVCRYNPGAILSNRERLGKEPAFASACANNESHHIETGMSKRFYAACAAMTGILSNENVLNGKTSNGTSGYVRLAYRCADELLKQENE